MVVPRSTELIADDSEYCLYTVTLFKKVVEEFKLKAREQKYVIGLPYLLLRCSTLPSSLPPPPSLLLPPSSSLRPPSLFPSPPSGRFVVREFKFTMEGKDQTIHERRQLELQLKNQLVGGSALRRIYDDANHTPSTGSYDPLAEGEFQCYVLCLDPSEVPQGVGRVHHEVMARGPSCPSPSPHHPSPHHPSLHPSLTFPQDMDCLANCWPL